jgi:hypothetical protein
LTAPPEPVRDPHTGIELARQIEFPYPFDAAQNAIAYNLDGSPAVFVAPPWATDANGEAVKTHYTMHGNTITQHIGVTKDSAFPVVADPWLGVDLLSKFKWWTYEGKPAISVSVTPMMAAINSHDADWAGWSELLNKVTRSSKSKGTELRKVTYRQQWLCHAWGKALIGVGGWLRVDKKPTWDLESSRGTSKDPVKAVSSKCSW